LLTVACASSVISYIQVKFFFSKAKDGGGVELDVMGANRRSSGGVVVPPERWLYRNPFRDFMVDQFSWFAIVVAACMSEAADVELAQWGSAVVSIMLHAKSFVLSWFVSCSENGEPVWTTPATIVFWVVTTIALVLSLILVLSKKLRQTPVTFIRAVFTIAGFVLTPLAAYSSAFLEESSSSGIASIAFVVVLFLCYPFSKNIMTIIAFVLNVLVPIAMCVLVGLGINFLPLAIIAICGSVLLSALNIVMLLVAFFRFGSRVAGRDWKHSVGWTIGMRGFSTICGIAFLVLLFFDLSDTLSRLAAAMWFLWVMVPFFSLVPLSFGVKAVYLQGDIDAEPEDSEDDYSEERHHHHHKRTGPMTKAEEEAKRLAEEAKLRQEEKSKRALETNKVEVKKEPEDDEAKRKAAEEAKRIAEEAKHKHKKAKKKAEEEEAAKEKEEAKSEEPRSEEPRSRSEEPRSEEPRSRSEEPRSEEPRSEEPRSEEPKSEEPKSEEPKSEEPRSEEPKSEAEEDKSEKNENKNGGDEEKDVEKSEEENDDSDKEEEDKSEKNENKNGGDEEEEVEKAKVEYDDDSEEESKPEKKEEDDSSSAPSPPPPADFDIPAPGDDDDVPPPADDVPPPAGDDGDDIPPPAGDNDDDVPPPAVDDDDGPAPPLPEMDDEPPPPPEEGESESRHKHKHRSKAEKEARRKRKEAKRKQRAEEAEENNEDGEDN